MESCDSIIYLLGEGRSMTTDVNRLETKLNDHDKRISNLETRVSIAENNITAINQKLDKIDSNISKLIWIVLAAIIGAVLRSIGLI